MHDWHKAVVAPDESHHVLDGEPLYRQRYLRVMKYHEPGLAPAADRSGAFHIDVSGRPAYPHRYARTFGFYEGVAAVQAAEGWHHIGPDGGPLYPERYVWCGNMQGGRVTVRSKDGRYFHLRPDGRAAYTQRYRYAGDFRDGAACVRRTDGSVVPIDVDGRQLYADGYLDLDVFHKGFARARDGRGWFHCDRAGRPVYGLRLASVEPFYNGQAYCETHDGRRVILGETGEIVHEVWDPRARARSPGPAVLVVGNVGTGKSALGRSLADHLGWGFTAIDDARRLHGDGSASGEVAAWSAFLRLLGTGSPIVAEFSGTGPFVHLVRHARGHRPFRVLWLKASIETCRARMQARRDLPPYPDFGVPLQRLVGELGPRLEAEMAQGLHWHPQDVLTLDAEPPAAAVAATAERLVRDWLGELTT